MIEKVKNIFSSGIFFLTILSLCIPNIVSSSDIFDAEIFSDGKEFISSSSKPQIYLKFHETNLEKWFNVFSYNKVNKSQEKKLGQLEISYASNDDMISIQLSQWAQADASHMKEVIETGIELCRGEHMKHHFSCQTSFVLALQGDDKALADSIGFKLAEGKYKLPFKSLELGKFQHYDLSLPRRLEKVMEGSQYPYYGPIESFIWDDLKSFQKTKTPFVWCDLGCGTGLFPLRLLEKSDYISVIASDYQPPNLEILKTFITQAEEQPFKKEIVKNLTIVQSDINSFKSNAEFIPLIQKGINRFSIMNVSHYLSPLHNILALAQVSEMLPPGGRVYLTHDTNYMYEYMVEEMEPQLKMCTNAQKTIEYFRMDADFGQWMYKKRITTIINFLKEKNYEFPEYINADVLSVKGTADIIRTFCGFCFPPSFMLEIAETADLKLLHKGEVITKISRAQNKLEYEGAHERRGTKAWYIFEKISSDPSASSVTQSFRLSDRFRKLIERARLADTQRKDLKKQFNINIANEYPFITIKKLQ